jgi:hypothetical protein
MPSLSRSAVMRSGSAATVLAIPFEGEEELATPTPRPRLRTGSITTGLSGGARRLGGGRTPQVPVPHFRTGRG